MASRSPIPPQPFLGAIAGLIVGVLLSLYVVMLVLFSGTSMLEGYGTTLPVVVGIYVVGGGVGGLVVGCLLPLGRWWPGAMIVGYIGVLPAYAMVAMAMTPASKWSTEIPEIMIFVAGPVGAGVGLLAWRQARREGKI